jgi:hypothetical protein
MVRNADGPAQSARWRNTISVSGIDGTGNDLDIAHPKLRMVRGLVNATTIQSETEKALIMSQTQVEPTGSDQDTTTGGVPRYVQVAETTHERE